MNIIPENDIKRIEALKRYKILDTPPENAFDNVAKLAAEIFDVPISLVSLVDAETVFFKANVGMGKTRSSARGLSLCSLAILDNEVTVFEDAPETPCLFANPLVAGEFGLKFYAGAPLVTQDGYNIGTLCIIDKQPRKFTQKEEKILKGLAKIVMDEIELRLSSLLEAEKQEVVNAKLVESEYKANFIVSDAPVAIGLLTGKSLLIEQANDKILELWDRTEEIIGKPLITALPELLDNDQPFLKILDEVLNTGVSFYGNEYKAILLRNDQLEGAYFNFVYHPVKNKEGSTMGIMVVATEVTEQVKLRRTIELKEQRLENMVMSTPVGMTVMKGRDLVIEIANDPMYQIWNRKAEQVLGKRLIDIFPELIYQPFPAMLASIFETGIPLAVSEIEVIISTDNGNKHIYADFKYAPLFDEEGNVEAIVATVIDITQVVVTRKLLEENEEELQTLNEELNTSVEELAASNEEMITTNEELYIAYQNLTAASDELNDSEARFRSMIEQAPVAILLSKGDEMITEVVNKFMLTLLDKDDTIIGKPYLEILPEIAAQPVIDLLYNVYHTGKPHYAFESPVMLNRNNRSEIGYFNYAFTPLYEQGKITGVLQLATEVTQQIRTKEDLQKVEAQLRFSVEAANVGTWFTDIKTMSFIPDGRMKIMFGYDPEEEMSFEAAINQITEEYRDKVVNAVNATIINSKNYNIEYPVIGFHDQKLRWVRNVGKLDNDADGKLFHFSGVAIDITEQKQDELRKNDFIAMVSHELKTPLTSLKGYLQLLAARNKKNDDGFTTAAIEKGNHQVSRMTALINGFLNVSQLEAGKIYLDKDRFQLDQLMSEIGEEVSATTASHQILVTPCIPIFVHADREKIGQVITNFLSNAVKYSPMGNVVKLSCRIVDQMVVVSVKDQGIGISEKDKEKLFDRFYRVEDPQAKSISGFGIGLYLCAEIIQRHDGKIWVESEKGNGSTFYFSLPMV